MKTIILIIVLLVLEVSVKGQENTSDQEKTSNHNPVNIQNTQNNQDNFSVKQTKALDKILSDIASNNKRLKALRELYDAEKTGNKTGLNPVNPEIEFNYLWGEQPLPGNRKDLRVIQSFDFPTVYNHRKEVANIKNKQLDYEYRKEYMSVMHSATMLYIEFAYLDSYIEDLTRRTEDAKILAQAMESELNAGEANILEYNKALLNLANQQQLLIEQTSILNNVKTALTALNGGDSLTIDTHGPYIPFIEADFETWYPTVRNTIPDIQWMEQQSLLNAEEVKLNASLTLPKITAGYMSENLPEEKFSGITVGMTIPLWENRNLVKSSRLKSIASQNLMKDMQQQFYFRLKAKHQKVITSLANAKSYRSEIESHTNAGFLRKAFDSGEISLIEYLTELSFYYESMDRLLKIEREAGIVAADLLYYQD
ncbi:MAG TPA: TolC family protein [Lentimicrobium sp.]|nr:TolC family protein [Lentimicrobium sp.]